MFISSLVTIEQALACDQKAVCEMCVKLLYYLSPISAIPILNYQRSLFIFYKDLYIFFIKYNNLFTYLCTD